ncbi:hypothetical protein [Streptomyces sp. NPDC015131]|uniref:hypothetical protein n=1 Tax=Streptomyces sp. NPDC015131 TaxID=3364941 RepID=UPI003702F964
MPPLSDYKNCHVCGKALKPTQAGKYRIHTHMGRPEKCEASGTYIPAPELPETLTGVVPPLEDDECTDAASPTAPSAEFSTVAATAPATSATTTTGSSPTGPGPEAVASSGANATGAVVIPGATEYAEQLGGVAAAQYEAYRTSVNSAALSAAAERVRFAQPASWDEPVLFSQPTGGKPAARPMTDLGKEVTARLKEMFHGYTNRQERSQQATLGPSEIGSPCDRRLAMSLMRMPRVNPGGDNWASFVGTCIHAGLADMLTWADAGSGRYAVETPLIFPSELVPRGTGDLLDRVLLMFLDHKAMGRWSRDKLKAHGPSQTYRVQVHTYAYGARLRGEQVDHVAIVGWPRDEASLDDLYTWTEPYNPKIALDAFARVERIAERVQDEQCVPAVLGEPTDFAAVSAAFPVAPDCRWCPFHLPGAKDLSGGGCNGRA